MYISSLCDLYYTDNGLCMCINNGIFDIPYYLPKCQKMVIFIIYLVKLLCTLSYQIHEPTDMFVGCFLVDSGLPS